MTPPLTAQEIVQCVSELEKHGPLVAYLMASRACLRLDAEGTCQHDDCVVKASAILRLRAIDLAHEANKLLRLTGELGGEA